MKTGRLTLVLLTFASGSVFAQQDSPQCVLTNYDKAQDAFTVMNPQPGMVNQQCFLTVHPAGAALPSDPAGRFVEGSYEILLSGGGGGGGGDRARGGGGQGGAGAVPHKTKIDLTPGVYRLTMGTGGLGGASCPMEGRPGTFVRNEPLPGGRGNDGNPTGLAEAYSGKTIAGFPRAELWAGGAEQFDVASGRRIPTVTVTSAATGHDAPAQHGPNGGTRDGPCEAGYAGGHGFIKLTLLAQAQAPAPAPVIQPAPAPEPVVRPKRKDRG